MTQRYDEPTYAVIGDVGGHYAVLRATIESLGVYKDGKDYIIPNNLTIIQSGDLVNKGPQSNECVNLVGNLMDANNNNTVNGQWVQLIGNHESNYIPGAPKFINGGYCDLHSIHAINDWWRERRSSLYYLIPQNEGKPFMVTHAGVGAYVYQMFQDDVNTPTVESFMKNLDKNQVKNMRNVSTSGVMLNGRMSLKAGVFWAEAYSEVYNTWKYFKNAPFHQIHGHSTPFDWPTSKFRSGISETFKTEIILDKDKRHSKWSHKETDYYGIDPGFNKSSNGRKVINPLMLNHNGIIE